MEKSENELAAAAQSGDSAAFGQLYDRYAPQLYRYFTYRTSRKETAEDLTSTTFTKALEHLKTFDATRGAWGAWIYRIARNTLIDHLRRTRDTSDIDLVWDLASSTDIPTEVETRIASDAAKKILSTLPKDTRDIIVMRLWDGLSHAEIAEITGKTEAASKMAYSRAIKALRDQLPLSLFILFLIQPH